MRNEKEVKKKLKKLETKLESIKSFEIDIDDLASARVKRINIIKLMDSIRIIKWVLE
jgi:hypothetical protein